MGRESSIEPRGEEKTENEPCLRVTAQRGGQLLMMTYPFRAQACTRIRTAFVADGNTFRYSRADIYLSVVCGRASSSVPWREQMDGCIELNYGNLYMVKK